MTKYQTVFQCSQMYKISHRYIILHIRLLLFRELFVEASRGCFLILCWRCIALEDECVLD
jgi:hypothetical protein